MNRQRRGLSFIALLLGLSLAAPHPGSIAQAADLATIIARGKLIVAVKDNTPPLGFVDRAGQHQGFEIDLARRLAAEILGNPDAVEFRALSSQARLNSLLQDDVDLVIARMSVNGSRARLVDFSYPYYLDSTGLILKSTTARSPSVLVPQKIAVLQGSSTIAIVRSQCPTCELIGVASYEAGRQALEQGRAEAFAADNALLVGWMQEYPQYRQLPIHWWGSALSVAMPKGLQYGTLRDRVNLAIAHGRRSGWLKERAQYWGLPWFDGFDNLPLK